MKQTIKTYRQGDLICIEIKEDNMVVSLVTMRPSNAESFFREGLDMCEAAEVDELAACPLAVVQ